jgi:hypothetical protein
MDSYPFLNFLVRFGRALAFALAAAVFAAGALAALALHAWPWALIGALGAVIAYGFAASYAELVRLVTDMLVPK